VVRVRERGAPDAAVKDKRGLTRLGSTRRWAWRQSDKAAARYGFKKPLFDFCK
jgi:hypothetical protein